MQCESRGELYPITNPDTSQSTFVTLEPSLFGMIVWVTREHLF